MDIRQVLTEDYAALAPLWNRVYTSDHYSATELAYLDTVHEPPCQCARFVLTEGNRIVGSASYMQFIGSYHPQVFMINVLVDPEVRNRGYGSALYQYLSEQVSPFKPIRLNAQVRETELSGMRFARARGFSEVKRDWEAVLDLTSFQPELYPVTLPAGVQIVRYPELPDTETRDQIFHRLYSELRQDVPRSEPATPIDYAQFRKLFFDAPDFYRDGLFVAVHQNNLIGTTMFWKSELGANLHTGLTGVKASFRGQGIAKALKITALRFAKAQGFSKIFTDNDTSNVEMIAINDRLGFIRQPAWVSLRKTLMDTPNPLTSLS